MTCVSKHYSTQNAKERGGHRGRAIVLSVLLVLCLAGAGWLVYSNFLAPKEDAGASITSYEGMSDEEIQAALDRQTEASRMTISVAAHAQLDGNRVRVNVVNDKDNPYDQQFKLEQDGKTLYESGIVKCGKTVEWADAEGAHTGDATITVTAVDKDSGEAVGNPQSVSIQITDKSE